MFFFWHRILSNKVFSLNSFLSICFRSSLLFQTKKKHEFHSKMHFFKNTITTKKTYAYKTQYFLINLNSNRNFKWNLKHYLCSYYFFLSLGAFSRVSNISIQFCKLCFTFKSMQNSKFSFSFSFFFSWWRCFCGLDSYTTNWMFFFICVLFLLAITYFSCLV